MYVIPILIQKVNESVQTCWILLERNGTACIQVNSVEEAVAFAAENEIVAAGPPLVKNNYVFIPVDSHRTYLPAFYSWGEVLPNEQPMREVWRAFIWRTPGDSWGTNTMLDSVRCSPDSVGQILNSYFSMLKA
jgi:hypothetical protein